MYHIMYCMTYDTSKGSPYKSNIIILNFLFIHLLRCYKGHSEIIIFYE